MKKNQSRKNHTITPLVYGIRTAILTAGITAATSGVVIAGPTGGVITHGSGQISNPNAQSTIINQNSQKLVADWQTFNVRPGETVTFKQPNSLAIALNNILDHNPSQVFGSINANGRVFLVNPNGMYFGPSARVNVGSLVATTLKIDSKKFMSGMNVFGDLKIPAGEGVIVNQGLLQAATGGSISLIAGEVRNEGVIVANLGHVNLASGRKATLDFDGDGLIQFEIQGNIEQNTSQAENAVLNSGEIIANGGQVLLTAAAAKDVFTNVVNNEGIIRANTIENRNGEIFLVGVDAGIVRNSGLLDASGTDTGETGGTIKLLGEKVGLFNGAQLNASGNAGGGEVLIGGNYQGKGVERNATYTYIDKIASINADALENGNGGKVIVWADNTTRFYGDISATGGSVSGNGGFVETSGKKNLLYRGSVELSSVNGAGGVLLLDPDDIVIADGAPVVGDDSGQVGAGDGSVAFTDGTGTFTIAEQALEGIGSGVNIVLQANNSITIDDLTDDTLTLDQTGSVTFQTTNGVFSMDATDTIDLTGGASLTVTTGGDIAMLNLAGVTNLTLDTKGSFNVINTGALTDLSVTVDPAGGGPKTYNLTAPNVTFNVTDGGATLDITNVFSGTLANLSISTDTGDINVGVINTVNTNVTLASTQGSLVDNTSNIIAVDLSLTANGLDQSIGASGAGAIDLTLSGQVDASASDGTGGIYLTQTNDMNIGVINAATGDVELVSTTGSIIEASVDTVNKIIAANLSLTADASGATIGTSAPDAAIDVTLTGDLTASAATGSGGVFLSESNNMDVAFIDAGTGTVELSSTGSINDAAVDTAVDITAATTVLTAPGGIGETEALELANVTDLTLDSNGSFNISNTGTLTDLAVTIDPTGGAETYSLTSGGGATFSLTDNAGVDADLDLTTVNASSLNYTLTTDTGNINVGTVSAGTGNVNLISTAGSLVDSSSSITANNLVLTVNGANQAIGTNGAEINTTLSGTVTADASNGTGGVFISESNNMDVAVINAGTGTAELSSTGSINDATVDTVVDITAATAVLTAPGGIGETQALELANVTDLTLDTNGSFDIDNTGTLTDLAVTLDPTGGAETYSLTSGGLTTFTLADNAGVDADLDLSNVTAASNLNFSLTTDTGNINVGAVSVGTGNVNLTSTGSINDATVDTVVDITAATAVLISSGGIGETQALELANVTDLTLDTNGSFNVSNTGTLTDLAVTLDPTGGAETYSLSSGGLTTFTLTDNAGVDADLDLTNVTATANLNFTLSTDTGNVNVGTIIVSSGNVSVTSVLGSLLDNTSVIFANNLVLTANGVNQVIGASGAEINTVLTGAVTADASNGTGGVFISESNNMDVAVINAGTGTAELSSTGSINDATVDTVVDITAATAVLTAPGGIGETQALELANVTDLTIDSNGSFDIDNTGTLTDLAVTLDPTGGAETYSLTSGGLTTFTVTDNAVDADLDLSNVTAASNLNFSLTTDTGNINVGTVSVGTGNVNLTTTAGSLVDSTSSISANNLVLTATGANQAIGANGAEINTTLLGAVTADASNGTGGVFLSESNNMDVAVINAGTGTVELSSTGTINDAAADIITDITAATAILTAPGGIGETEALELANVTDLTLDSNGSFNISNTGTLTDLAVTIDPTGGAETYSLTSGGGATFSLTDNAGVDADLDLSNVTAASNLNFSLTTDTGNINVGTVSVGTGNVNLTSTAGSLVDNTSSITANNLVLTANGANQAIGANGAEINTTLSGTVTADASNGTGGVFISESNNMDVAVINAGTGTAELSSTGSINDATVDTVVDITAATAVLTAPGGIGETQALELANVTDLTIDSNGSFDIDNTGTLTDLAVTLDPTGGAETYSLTSGGLTTFTVTDNAVDADLDLSNVTAASNLNFSLTTDTGNINVGTVSVGTGNVNLTTTAGSLVDSTSSISANNLVLTATGANQAIGANGAEINTTLLGAVTADASNGTGGVFLSESNNMDVAVINAGTGTVELSSTGTINDAAADIITDITAATAILTAPGGIGETEALELANVTDLTLDSNGSFNISNTGTLTDLAVTIDPTGGAETYSLTSGGGATFSLTDNAGVDADLDLSNVTAASNLNFSLTTDTGNINVGTVSVGTGNVNLTSTAGSLVDNTSSITANNLVLTANGANQAIGANGAEINTTLSGTVTADASNGTGGVFISESNNMDVAVINAGTGTAELSSTGSINDATVDTVVDITAATAVLSSPGGIGETQALELANVTDLTLDTNGSFNVSNTGTLTDLTVTLDPTGGAETYSLTSGGLTTFTLTDNAVDADLDLSNVTAASNLNFSLTIDTGNINVGTVSVGTGNVNLTSTAGSLVDNTSSITANNLVLTANGVNQAIGANGAEINTTLSGTVIADASNGTGGIFLNETNSVDIARINSGTGDLEISSSGDINDSGTIDVGGQASFNAGANAITLGDGIVSTNFGSVNLTGGAVTVSEDSDTVLAGVSVSSLDITSTGTITDTGDITVTGLASFNAGANAITLGDGAVSTNFGSVNLTGGAVTVTEDSDTVLAGVSASSLDITSTGTITDTGDITVTGLASFDAGANAITLGDGAVSTNFGSVNLTGGAVTVTEDSDTVLAGVSASSLDITSTGTITDTGDIAVTGLASFDAGANAITLGDGAVSTNFGSVNLTGGAVTVTEDSDTVLAGVSASSLDITSTGTITDTGDIAVTGLASFDAGANAITLGDGIVSTNFGSVNLTGGAVTVSEDSDTVLAGVSVSSLDITSTGTITDTGDITVTGLASFNAGANAITLGDGAVSTNFGSVNLTGGAVTVTEDSDTVLAGVSASSLDITSTGTITDTGDIAVTGLASFDAGANAITLGDGAVSTNFGSVNLTGGSVTVTEDSDTVLARVSASSLDITSTGTITDTGDIAVTGLASFNAGANAITLGDGAVSTNFGSVNLTGGAVTVTEDSDTVLAGMSASSLDITSTGTITDTGDIAVTGLASFDAGANAITLGDGAVSTNFGSVNLTGGSVTVTEDSDTVLARVSASSLDITSTGTITDTGDIAVTGLASFNAGANAITLGDGAVSTNFGSVNLTGGAVTVTEDSDTVLAGMSASSLDITSTGTITDTGDIAVTGLASFDAGTNAITLGDGTTANFGSIKLTGGNMTVTEASDMLVNEIKSNGIVKLNVGGNDIQVENEATKQIAKEFHFTARNVGTGSKAFRPVGFNGKATIFANSVSNVITLIGDRFVFAGGFTGTFIQAEVQRSNGVERGRLIETEGASAIDAALFDQSVTMFSILDPGLLLPTDQLEEDEDEDEDVAQGWNIEDKLQQNEAGQWELQGSSEMFDFSDKMDDELTLSSNQ